jgi:hypothetical protein
MTGEREERERQSEDEQRPELHKETVEDLTPDEEKAGEVRGGPGPPAGSGGCVK